MSDPFNIKQQLLNKLGDALDVPMDANRNPNKEQKTTQDPDKPSENENYEEQ